MFGNQNKSNYEKANTLIGEGATLEAATFKSNGTIRIDGTYIGKIILNGDLVLDTKGIIEGNVEAHHALISGKITGDISCSEEIHLSSSAIVVGNICCGHLIIDEGATFNGISTMTTRTDTKRSKKPQEPIAN
jgi:cytoskeletal protein CcmA (bactofilin family)